MASGHRGRSRPGCRGSGPQGPFSFLLPRPVSLQPALSLKGHGRHAVALHACLRAPLASVPGLRELRGTRVDSTTPFREGLCRVLPALPEPRPVSLPWWPGCPGSTRGGDSSQSGALQGEAVPFTLSGLISLCPDTSACTVSASSGLALLVLQTHRPFVFVSDQARVGLPRALHLLVLLGSQEPPVPPAPQVDGHILRPCCPFNRTFTLS